MNFPLKNNSASFILGLALIFIPLDTSAGDGYLGIVVQDLSRPMKIALGIDYGILVTSVMEKSPAAKSGLREGDIITMVNREKINNVSDLIMEANKNTGKSVQITVLRKNKKQKFTVTPRKSPGTRFRWHYRFDRYGDDFSPPFFPEFPNDEIENMKKEMKEMQKKLKRLYKELGKEYNPSSL